MVNATMGERVAHGTDEPAGDGSFERDTLTWAFAKLAEYTLDELFRHAEERAKYARWLAQEAPLLIASGRSEQGLLLIDLDLALDGRLSLIARPCEGEFLLTARHPRFDLVLASAYCALAACPEQECICVAHFEGDSALAARWAWGLRHSFDRRPRSTEAGAPAAGARLH